MSWQTSPAATEVEEVVMDWLRQMVGPVRRLDRRRARYGQHGDAVRAALRAREGLGLQPERRRAAGARRAARRLRLEPGAQLDREGGAARGVRQGASAAHRDRRRPRAARRPAGGRDRCRRAPAAWCPCALVASIGTTGTTAIDPLAAMARCREAARPLAPRGRGARGLRDGAAGVPAALGRRRERRQPGLQPAQVDGGRLRLLRATTCATRST